MTYRNDDRRVVAFIISDAEVLSIIPEEDLIILRPLTVTADMVERNIFDTSRFKLPLSLFDGLIEKGDTLGNLNEEDYLCIYEKGLDLTIQDYTSNDIIKRCMLFCVPSIIFEDRY